MIMGLRFGHWRLAIAIPIFCVLGAIWIPLAGFQPLRRRLPQVLWFVLLWAFRINIRQVGMPWASGQVLFAANHISWADIVVLGSLLDAGFVAKQEVRTWPIIGILAERYGCNFVSRSRRNDIAQQASQLEVRLRDRGRFILFPEGTSGPGNKVLPFRSSLFAAAISGFCLVQPIAIVWKERDGTPLNPSRLRKVAWIDNDELLPHALAFAAMGGVTVEVHFLAPLAIPDRKVVALSAHAAVDQCLRHAQAETLNRAA